MQIAIAGVEDVADENAVLLADRMNGLQDLGQTRPWDDRILHNEMRGESTHRAECFLASLPQLHALHVVARDLDVPRSSVETNLAHGLEIRDDAGFEAIELDE